MPRKRKLTAQQKTAISSVIAAIVLIALKLVTGLITGSLAFISGALESGLDLVTALMTLYAVGVAIRPADPEHPWGHAKAEHLAALAESTILFAASLWIGREAISRLSSESPPEVEATWWALLVIGIVIAIDLGRTIVSYRVSVRHRSAALQSNALNFGGDFLGSAGVLVGLVFARAGYAKADSVAALFVAVLVLIAAARLAYRNADILMDRSPRLATEAVQKAIEGVYPPVELKRVRVREAGGHYYAEAVIGISPEAAVGEGHAVSETIERVLGDVLHGGEVIVHVEPLDDEEVGLNEKVRAAAMSVRGVREIHNLSIVSVKGKSEASLHLKLPGELSLEQAHEMASQVEQAITEAAPEIVSVQTHLEPLDETTAGRAAAGRETSETAAAIRNVVRELSGKSPRTLRFTRTPEGLLVYLTLRLDPAVSLADAHRLASEIEARVHRERPEVSELVVHTEP
jgi:cation diffusion facilitator family transporter